MAYTQLDLTSIDQAIASGALSVAYEGKNVTYRSLQEMRIIRDVIRQELGLNAGKAKTFFAAHNRGFTP